MTPQTGKDKILIVDDQPENIWSLSQHLQSGFDVLCVTSGKEALEIAFSENRPDVILLDIMMPDMDGYQVCEKLKADDSTREIPVIFLTGKTADPEQVKGLTAGAQDYIAKPFSLPVVMARVKSVLNLKREMDRRLLLKTQLEALNRQLERQVLQKQRELEAAREVLTQYEEKWSSLFNRSGVDEKAPKRVLVVDDNPENVHILVNNLQSQYEVICTTGGKEALEIASSDDRPDIILLDIMMPDMDGYEVCSRLKANAETWSIPVIFITALGQDVDETRGLNLGAVDFITKPFSIPVAKARIEAHLRLKEEMDHRITLARKLEGLNKNLEVRIQKKEAALEQAHDDLKTSESKYRGIYENAIEGIFQTTPEGRFLDASPSLARNLGYQSSRELVATITDTAHQLCFRPQDWKIVLQALEQEGEIFGFETQIKKKNGEVIWVMISAKAVRDKNDELKYFQGFSIDIADRKRAEEELARHRDHLEELVRERTAELEAARNKARQYLDIAGVILVAIDTGRRVTLINKKGCEVLQSTSAEIIGKDWFETFVPENVRHDVIQAFRRLMAGELEPVEYFENPVLTQGGQERLVAWHHVLLRDGDGNISGTLSSGNDITERRRAEKQIKILNQDLQKRAAALEAANKEMHAFTYSVSHDLRAPLRHIDGFMELLQKKAETVLDEQSQHYMNTISHAANKMGLLIDDLLSFSRMGRQEMVSQQVDLGTLVREVILELEPDAAGRDIEWRICDLPAVGGDAAMLRIVLANLIANALKFTRPRQQARIEIGSLPGQDAEAVIFVRDNGVGFDMTYVDKLFGVFQRLHRADDFEGTGIGLANVRRIIARHGGRTWAEGKPDQGAAFFFALPRVV